MCVCVCVCLSMCVCVYVYIYIYIYMYMYICMDDVLALGGKRAPTWHAMEFTPPWDALSAVWRQVAPVRPTFS